MKLLLLGKNGQVGWELLRALAPLGEVVALGRDDNPRGDLGQPDRLRETVRDVAPDVIVNAAAYTAVDAAESQSEAARAINTAAPGVLDEEAAARGAWLIHYSTDYVFDGTGTKPWNEGSPTGPLNVYGQTKVAGEKAIRRSGCRHLILRTRWVYGTRGSNFAKTMLRLARERQSLAVVADQFGAPTGADLIADITAHAIRMAGSGPELSGTYHLAAGGEASWHSYARYLIGVARRLAPNLRAGPDDVAPVRTDAYATAARRPV